MASEGPPSTGLSPSGLSPSSLPQPPLLAAPAAARCAPRYSFLERDAFDNGAGRLPHALLRDGQPRSWSEAAYERAPLPGWRTSSNRLNISGPYSHTTTIPIAVPTSFNVEHPALPSPTHYAPHVKRESGNSWTASPQRSLKLESRYPHDLDAETAHSCPPPFPSTPSGEQLTITTRKLYDPEAAYGDVVHIQHANSETLLALMHLALLAPLVSLVIMVYTFLVLFIVFITWPFRLCIPPSTIMRARIISLLLPSLNLQRRCIFADPLSSTTQPPASHSSKEASAVTTSDAEPASYGTQHMPCKASALVLTHLLSPFISLPLSVCAWITALAWLPSAMIFHEQTSGVCDDEQRMAERLVGVWFWWLDWCGCEAEGVKGSEDIEEERGRRTSRDGGGGGRRSREGVPSR